MLIPPPQNETFVSTSKNLLKSRNLTFPVMRYFTWNLEFVSIILWMIAGSFFTGTLITNRSRFIKSVKWGPGSFLTSTTFMTFWDFLMSYQIFLSPQVKLCAIITYIHGIYELPHELPNDLTILGNLPTAFSPMGGLSCPHKKIKS